MHVEVRVDPADLVGVERRADEVGEVGGDGQPLQRRRRSPRARAARSAVPTSRARLRAHPAWGSGAARSRRESRASPEIPAQDRRRRRSSAQGSSAGGSAVSRTPGTSLRSSSRSRSARVAGVLHVADPQHRVDDLDLLALAYDLGADRTAAGRSAPAGTGRASAARRASAPASGSARPPGPAAPAPDRRADAPGSTRLACAASRHTRRRPESRAPCRRPSPSSCQPQDQRCHDLAQSRMIMLFHDHGSVDLVVAGEDAAQVVEGDVAGDVDVVRACIWASAAHRRGAPPTRAGR